MAKECIYKAMRCIYKHTAWPSQAACCALLRRHRWWVSMALRNISHFFFSRGNINQNTCQYSNHRGPVVRGLKSFSLACGVVKLCPETCGANNSSSAGSHPFCRRKERKSAVFPLIIHTTRSYYYCAAEKLFNPNHSGRFPDGGRKQKCLCVKISAHVRHPQVVYINL